LKKNMVIDKEHISALKKNICGMERHISGLKDAQASLHIERSEADGIILSLRHSLAETKECLFIAKEEDIKGEKDMRRALAAQQDELQRVYLSLLLQQTTSAMGVIQGQKHKQKDGDISQHQSLEEANDDFLNLMRTLPDAWRDSCDKQPQIPDSLFNSSPYHPSLPLSPVADPPFHIKASKTKAKIIYSLAPRESEGKETEHSIAMAKLKAAQFNGRPPSLKSTPTEQLLAAIGDGDIKGIKAVVKSKGDCLTSKYWRDIGSSILPLHKAISSLHHSGEVLQAITETLYDIGCDINECDAQGCSPLHRAITLCSERGLCLLVINILLSRGANPTIKNKEGDTPLNLLLRRAEASGNSWTDKTRLLVPSLEGDREVESKFQPTMDESRSADFRGGNSTNSTSRRNSLSPVTYHVDGRFSGTFRDREVPNSFEWVFVAQKLLRSGATWGPSSRKGCKDNQLHLLLGAFPSTNPTVEETSAYRFLLSSALASLDPTSEDTSGRNAVFILCDRLANIPAGAHLGEFPLHLSVVGTVLDALKSKSSGIGGSDRTGLTIFDIEESVHNSCLSAAKPMLFQMAARAAFNATTVGINSLASIRRNRSLDDSDHRNKHFYETAYSADGKASTYPSFISRCHSLDFQKRGGDTKDPEVGLFLN
jgi:hypothetical protein